MANEDPKQRDRGAPLDMHPDEFRRLGHALVDRIGEYLETLPQRDVTQGQAPAAIREFIGQGGLPSGGMPADQLLDEAAGLLFEHSLHNGHPRFLGYITSSGAPLGALGDLLASTANANLSKWELSPVASEIESQTIQWLAEFIGFPSDCGGIMVSGGNMANMLGFFAARRAQADWDIRAQGLYAEPRRLTVYASRETHTWIEKATDIAGLGTDAIRWIETNAHQQIEIEPLEQRIKADRDAGCLPFLLIGTAGSVSTGAIDPLGELARIAREQRLWFHVDGAYGAPAAVLPDAPIELRALAQADSIALDPHKWLYSPIEAACTLVRDPQHLSDAFRFDPDYYLTDDSQTEPHTDYYALGLQNSRGFRALKVWLALRHVGRDGYVKMIQGNIALAQYLFAAADAHAELEACTQHLSITTLRYVPKGHDSTDDDFLNALNRKLLTRLQKGGRAFVSNAIVDGKYLLRACVVNFRTREQDMDEVIRVIVDLGRELARESN
jgi:aromatic-L-amino-acid decarboxylase